MDVSRPRSLLREAFSSTASRSSTMAVSRSAVAPGSTSSPVPRRRGVTSGSPALPKASNSDLAGNTDVSPRMAPNMGVALELRAILAGAAAREVDRSSIFGCSPPPRDSFPLVRDDSFTKRLASSRAATPVMSSCSQVAWAGSSHTDRRFGSCNSTCSVAVPTASALSTA